VREAKMLIRKGEIGTPGKIRTYDLLLRRQSTWAILLTPQGLSSAYDGQKGHVQRLLMPLLMPLFSSGRLRNIHVIFLAAARG
jgi:hypothetical protein